MKKKLKIFELCVWGEGFVKVHGRDIWDAYKNACNKYDYVRKPYSSKRAAKFVKKTCNKSARKVTSSNRRYVKLMSHKNSGCWINTYFDTIYFD